MAKTVFRACNGCRHRKVRCNGSQPCAQCAHLNLTCVFPAPPAKRKSSARGRRVAQLRGKADGDPSESTERPKDDSAPTAATVTESSKRDRRQVGLVPIAPNTGYAPELFISLLSDFEKFVYPTNPVIPPDEIHASIARIDDNSEDAALVYAVAAVTTRLTKGLGASHGAVDTQVAGFIQHSLKAHRRVDMADMTNGSVGEIRANAKRIMTCVFLEMSTMTSKHFDRSFIILREAIAMIQTLGIHQKSTLDTARYQRLYCEAYIHERYVSAMTGYPCTLPPLATGVPMSDPNLPPHIQVGFNRLIRLFLILDGPFLDYLIAQRNPTQVPMPTIPAEWIESKQVQLDEDELGTVDAERELVAKGHSSLTEGQHVDLFITRLWLRTLVWQLALSHGLLRSTPAYAAHEGLSLHFPVRRLSTQLHHLVTRIRSFSSIAMHGSGILQKLFEITSTIADVLALPAGQGQPMEGFRPQIENFVFLAEFLLKFERIGEEQKRYLREKVAALQQSHMMPDLPN